MTETPQVLLQHHLKKLRLPTFQSEYAKVAQQCATESRDHVQYLLRLCELELIERERRMIERRSLSEKAGLPVEGPPRKRPRSSQPPRAWTASTSRSLRR